MIVVTTNELQGYRVVKQFGLVRGLSVRSRSIVGNIGAAIQIVFGGNISVYTKLADEARAEALHLLEQNAAAMGANAVLSMRFDSSELAGTMSEIVAYGTAVVVAPDNATSPPATE